MAERYPAEMITTQSDNSELLPRASKGETVTVVIGAPMTPEISL